MYKAGDIDAVSITSDLLDSWLNDDSTKDLVHGTRPNNSYSYFYSFNFDPEFDAEYEPDNWKIAVNNENFRLALTSAMDRVKALTVNEPYNPEGVLNNTVTPTAFCSAGGKDYTQYDALKSYSDGDSFDETKATEYRDAARKELEAAGCTFPVKVLMPYNPSTTNWDKECQVLEQQMEGVLGSDFIDIIVEAGPETGFLSSVRRSGCYAFMKCNWGADYADPETWTEPFTADNNYGFWDLSEDENTSALYKEYQAKVDEASAIYDDDEARYTAFSEAEAILIENAIIVPYSISSNGYEVSKLNSLEGEYAPYGMTLMKYKFMSVHDTSMSMDDWNTALDTWKSEREKAIAK
jgi:oligopeptide transport system substrate-binding protein